MDGGGDGDRCLVVEHEPGTRHRLGHRRRAVGDDGDLVVHRLEERDAEALVVRQADEGVRHPVPGGEGTGADRPGQVDGVAQAGGGDEALQGGPVRVRRRATDDVEAGEGVVHPPVRSEGLDEVVLRLVRRHPSDEQPVGAATGALRLEAVQLGVVHVVVEDVGVEEDRHDGRAAVARRDQLRLVVRRVGDGELDGGGELVELAAGLGQLGTDVRLPRLEEGSGGDVVVVRQLRLRSLQQPVRHRAPRRALVEQPRRLARRGTGELLVAPHGAAHLAVRVTDVDLRAEAEPPQHPLHLERVGADRVPGAERRHHLVDRRHGQCGRRATTV